VHPYSEVDLKTLATAGGLEIAELRPLGRAGFAVHFARI
jgi:hypothetical protein